MSGAPERRGDVGTGWGGRTRRGAGCQLLQGREGERTFYEFAGADFNHILRCLLIREPYFQGITHLIIRTRLLDMRANHLNVDL